MASGLSSIQPARLNVHSGCAARIRAAAAAYSRAPLSHSSRAISRKCGALGNGASRSEERSVGKESVSTCRSRWTPNKEKQTKRQHENTTARELKYSHRKQ